jgi:CTP-dependent riboflavin kinase
MRIKGHVFSGVMRGQPLIELYFHRIVGLIGFEPYKGTMDVELDKSIDIKMFASRTLEHVLMDGTKKIYAYLAPVDMIFQAEGRENRYRCWAIQQVEGPYGNDVVEIIAKDMLREKFGLKEGSEIEIEFFEIPHAERKGFISALGSLRPRRKTQLIKGR